MTGAPASFIVLATVATLSGMLVLRGRALWIRLGFEIACLIGLSWILASAGASPLLSGWSPGVANLLWVRILATAWWFVAARILSSLVGAVLGHDERSREARLLSDLLGAAVYLLALLCVLDFVLELPVKGVLATSGVVAVVIGLALQNTLADVFSGIAVGVEAPFSVGDRISLGDNVEGVVVQINWRSTRVKTDGDDVAIIPNSRVARLEIINRSVPTERRTAQVQIQCPVSVAPEDVIESLEQAILLSPRLITTPPASASLVQLGLKRNMFAVDYSVPRAADLGAAKNELLLSVRRQLHRTGLLSTTQGDPADHHGVDRSEILRSTGLFNMLPPEQLSDLASRLEQSTLVQGQRLFSQGEPDPTLYIIASGVLEISLDDSDGTYVSVGRIGIGDFVGEVCLLTGVVHPASATALTRCEIRSLSRTAIEPLMRSNPEIIPGIEQAVRVALEQISRGAPAKIGRHAAGAGPLLERIYGFFHQASGR